MADSGRKIKSRLSAPLQPCAPLHTKYQSIAISAYWMPISFAFTEGRLLFSYIGAVQVPTVELDSSPAIHGIAKKWNSIPLMALA